MNMRWTLLLLKKSPRSQILSKKKGEIIWLQKEKLQLKKAQLKKQQENLLLENLLLKKQKDQQLAEQQKKQQLVVSSWQIQKTNTGSLSTYRAGLATCSIFLYFVPRASKDNVLQRFSW